MQRLFNFRPAVISFIYIILGIICAYFFFVSKIFLGIISLVVGLSFLILPIFLCKKQNLKKSIICSIIFCVLATFAAFTFTIKVNNYVNAKLNNHYYFVQGKVCSVEIEDDTAVLIVDNPTFSGIYNGKTGYDIVLYVYNDTDFEIGDNIAFTSLIVDKDIFYEERFSASNIEKGIRYFAEATKTDVVVIDNEKNIFEKINSFIKESLSSGLKEDNFSVAYALLTGYTGYMEDYTLNNFRAAGVAHIFAVSGLHIGFFATAIGFVLGKLRVKNTIRYLIIVLSCFFYSGICGFSASSLRATIMCAVLGVSIIFGDKYDGLSSLGTAGSIILLFSPIQLFRAGFILSFGVVLGILLFGEPISKWFKFLPKKIAYSIGSAISAEIVSIPISIYFFSKFSVIGVIANILFLPIVGIIFIGLFISTILGGIFGISYLSLFVFNYIIGAILQLIYAFDLSVFLVGGIALGISPLLYYLALVFSSEIINIKRSIKMVITICLSVVFAFSITAININENNRLKMYVVGSDNISGTLIYDKSESVFVVSNVKRYYPVSRLKRLSENSGLEKINTVVIQESVNSVDLQSFLTKFYSVFKIENLVYYGEQNTAMENVIYASFNDVNCCAVKSNIAMPMLKFDCKYLNDGYAFTLKKDDNNVLIFSKFGDYSFNYYGILEKFTAVVCYDYIEQIDSIYNPCTIISYRTSERYNNGENAGNLKVYLN